MEPTLQSGSIGLYLHFEHRGFTRDVEACLRPPLNNQLSAADVQALCALIDKCQRDPFPESIHDPDTVTVDGGHSDFVVYGDIEMSVSWKMNASDSLVEKVAPILSLVDELFARYPLTADGR